ncbi:hypothetical protein [Pseudarthrobacter sp. PS3-L1]|uniref:hypothetical protein n=1 Tax=Pseudarthrobacter sp. PS3-L1 TaxID=3046207 RepID=UPI0024BB994F|nr:hypothetical protein [Pseudarthrobacter sp. PS3-L1]MDJ0322094.1 hypothetical protein [Pseudarthrobacter sp. PS3-L1]
MNESDGIGEIFDDLLRQALMVAARIGEAAARARQQNIQEAEARSVQEGREVAARFDAERLSARTALAPLTEETWWKDASAEQIGAAYETATTWAGEDADISRTLDLMNDELAKRGITVSNPRAGAVTELVQARQWAAENNPTVHSFHSREMIKASITAERERLNNNLVASYLAREETPTYTADERAPEHARQQGAPGPDAAKAAALRGDADKLRGAAYFKEAAAAGNNLDGDAAAYRSDELHKITPLDMETGPGADDAAWYAQEAKRNDAAAAQNWDTADRREEFAHSLHGKADQAAVEARVLADLSQGTHPTTAVKGAAPTATKARKNVLPHKTQALAKGGR